MAARRSLVLLVCAIVVALATLMVILMAINEHQPTTQHLRHHSRLYSPEEEAVLAAECCDGALFPELCVSTLTTSVPKLAGQTLPEIISSTINHTAGEVVSSSRNFSDYLDVERRSLDALQRLALADCIDLFSYTVDRFRSAVADLRRNASSHRDDVRILLSAAIANQLTCLDGFAYCPGGGYRPRIEARLQHITKLLSNSLAMVKKIEKKKKKKRHEAFEGYGGTKSGFPEWVNAGDRRRLLQSSDNSAKAAPPPDLIVAKDGSGNFTTISAAVAAAPNNSASRFVIHIKGGAYFENVEVGVSKTNIMFIGDGIGVTVVKANRSVVDGWTTFRSATLAVMGDGFLARGLTVENSAGVEKHQAVALRVGADFSAFYRCSFVGFQDTLYAHSLRQFYRECNIYGTVDFVFGDAAAVFQNCSLYARVPLPTQKNTYTAQGRSDPNENTGFSILGSKIAAAVDLIPVQSQYQTYLGRPWKEYSRTVVMESKIEDLVDPAGWLEWNGTFALSTLYYGEYRNRGPGSNTSDRVTWPGFHVINSSDVASQFTARELIQGAQWLSNTTTPFFLGLS